MPKRVTRHSPNASSRHGIKPDTIVIHTTEGSCQSAINWFLNPSADASSHEVICENGDVTVMVPDHLAAWTSGGGPIPNMNSRALQIELAGFAAQTNRFWRHSRRAQLHSAAKSVARWSRKYGIPIQRGELKREAPGEVVGHVHVSGPGGHHDPGTGFPWRTFLLLCKLYKLRQAGVKPALQERWRTIVMDWLRR